MREMAARLRAAITPQAMLALAAAVLLLVTAFSSSGAANNASRLEKQTARVLSAVDGAGKVSVAIRMQMSAGSSSMRADQAECYPAGAIAVAQGADDPVVRIELQQALCALLALPASAVSVVTGGQ